MSHLSSDPEPTVEEPMLNEAKAYPYNASNRRGPIEGPGGRKLVRRITWRSTSYKFIASLWVLGVLYLLWLIRGIFFIPFASWYSPGGPASGHFAQFHGYQECGISSHSIYGDGHISSKSYCQNPSSLLEAMSNGGRIGIDASYASRDCSYRWYSTAQICEILQKFDGIIFAGEQSLANVYAGFNILLRRNLATGSLKDWEMNPQEIKNCSCNSQFTDASCMSHRISSSNQVDNSEDSQYHYACPLDTETPPHAYIQVTNTPMPKPSYNKYRQLLSTAKPKTAGQRKHIPVIHSISQSTSFSTEKASRSMNELRALARYNKLLAPFLWVGPTAPGLKRGSSGSSSSRSGEQPDDDTVWSYSLVSAGMARERSMDVLGMYNATVQAESFDGLFYGEEVALLQAMMIVNWLSTL